MGRMSFEASQAMDTYAEGNNVGFFSLKNDNDEAIVRIMHDSTEDFDILTLHDIQVGGKWRKISCVRNLSEPIDSCPLCQAGEKLKRRFFIHMIEYVKDEAGNIVPHPVIWDRDAQNYANKIKSYIDNYGPMSEVMCKIIRHGKAGDMKTEYEIIPNLNKQIYRDDLYPKVSDAFKDFDVLGTVVMDRTADEIRQWQQTGQFPERKKKDGADVTSAIDAAAQNWDQEQQTPNYYIPDEIPNTATIPTVAPAANTATPPWATNNSTAVARPRRTYQ